jgi:hypothetical protein
VLQQLLCLGRPRHPSSLGGSERIEPEDGLEGDALVGSIRLLELVQLARRERENHIRLRGPQLLASGEEVLGGAECRGRVAGLDQA